jgi:hypothetical protein
MTAFTYEDEFYPALIFNKDTQRIVPILRANLPKEAPKDHILAWAFERRMASDLSDNRVPLHDRLLPAADPKNDSQRHLLDRRTNCAARRRHGEFGYRHPFQRTSSMRMAADKFPPAMRGGEIWRIVRFGAQGHSSARY